MKEEGVFENDSSRVASSYLTPGSFVLYTWQQRGSWPTTQHTIHGWSMFS